MQDVIVVGMADMQVGKAPIILRTSLGSCVAVCIYCKQKKIGGLLHFMLSDSSDFISKGKQIKRAKYADTGIEDLLKRIEENFGVKKSDITGKIFGGANILQMCSLEIGKKNEDIAVKILKEKGIKIEAMKTGGSNGYKIEFVLETGHVHCQVFGNKEEIF